MESSKYTVRDFRAEVLNAYVSSSDLPSSPIFHSSVAIYGRGQLVNYQLDVKSLLEETSTQYLPIRPLNATGEPVEEVVHVRLDHLDDIVLAESFLSDKQPLAA